MKLLFYIHGITGGGGERVLSTLVNEFSIRGEEVFLATDIHNSFAYDIDKRVKLYDLYDKCNKDYGTFSSIKNSVVIRRNIRRIAKKTSPDVIIAFMSALGCSVIVSTIGLKIPIVVSEHTNVSRFLGYSLNIKRKLLYPLANCITVLTRHDEKLWRNKVKNVVYMPNPINLKTLHTSKNNRNKVVLAVGRVNQWEVKGFDNLIFCWSKLCSDFPDWKLQIVGNSDKDASVFLKKMAIENNCQNYEFVGFRKDVDRLMQQSEIFCLSSRTEGLPMALIEAMNAGCCCVSFDVVTGPREIIVANKSGLLAKNQDNEDFVEKLRQVMSDETLRHHLAANAPSSVVKFSTKRIIHRWYILFDKIVKK